MINHVVWLIVKKFIFENLINITSLSVDYKLDVLSTECDYSYR